MDVLTKQPSEEVTRGARLGTLLRPGRYLVGCDTPTVIVHRQNADGTAQASDLTISAPVLGGDGTEAQVKIEGGVSGAVYKLKFVGHDDDGDVLEVDGLLKVRDR